MSETRIEAVSVVAAFLVLAPAVLIVGLTAAARWPAGFFSQLVEGATALPFVANKNVPIAFCTGTIGGWFLLFVIDGTKRVQAGVSLLVGVVPLAFIIQSTGRLTGAIGESPTAAVVGLLVGLLSGWAASRFYGVERPSGLAETLRWIQFPAATGAFFYSVSALTLVAGVDRLIAPGGVVERVGAFLAATGVVVSLAVFTRYDYQRNVVVVTPDEEEGWNHPYVLGGLYKRAKVAYNGFPFGESNAELDRAGGAARDRSDLSNRFGRAGAVSFGFVSPTRNSFAARLGIPSRWFAKTVVVSSDRRTANQLDTDRVSSARKSAVEWLAGQVYRAVVPRVGVRQAGNKESLDDTNTVLLVCSLSESSAVIESYKSLCNQYSGPFGPEVVVVVTESEAVAEETGTTGRTLERVVAERIGLESTPCTVVPVWRFGDDGEYGFDRLLEEIAE